MKKSLLFVAASAFAMVTVPALATPGGEGKNTGCNGVGNVNSPCDPSPTPTPVPPGNNGGNGGAVGDTSAIGVGVGIGFGGAGGSVGDTSASVGDVSSASVSNATAGSTSNATGGSVGDTSQNNTNTISNGSNNSSQTSLSTSISYNHVTKIPVSTAYAAPLVASIDTCYGSFSGGVQTKVLGISFGGTKKDGTCELIKLSREAGLMGMADVQCELLAQDERFAKALELANRSCRLPPKIEIVEVPFVVPAPAPIEVKFNYANEYPNDPGERG